jgi:LysR family transcriptional regulator, flagellar master operon regulator
MGWLAKGAGRLRRSSSSGPDRDAGSSRRTTARRTTALNSRPSLLRARLQHVDEFNRFFSATRVLYGAQEVAPLDIELARTFLEIVRTRSFVRAAEQLNLSQTAVSARVRALEEQLGRPLFVRNKNGASLTPAGEQFLRYAPMFVQLWQRARHQVAVPLGRRAVLSIGGELSLWHPLLLEWLHWMRRSAPDVALRVEVGVAESLTDQVATGALDVAVMCAPQYRPGARVELLLEEKLVLVTTDPDAKVVDPNSYVYVDWGPDFAHHHELSFPEKTNPGLFVGLGPLALTYVLEAGGSGYFRQRVVAPHLAAGKLHLVAGAPSFFYPIYAVCSAQADDELVNLALEGLRTIAAAGGAEKTLSRDREIKPRI